MTPTAALVLAVVAGAAGAARAASSLAWRLAGPLAREVWRHQVDLRRRQLRQAGGNAPDGHVHQLIELGDRHETWRACWCGLEADRRPLRHPFLRAPVGRLAP